MKFHLHEPKYTIYEFNYGIPTNLSHFKYCEGPYCPLFNHVTCRQYGNMVK